MDREQIFRIGAVIRIAELESELAELRAAIGQGAKRPRTVVEQAVKQFEAHKEGNGKVSPRLRVRRVSDEPAFTSFVTKLKPGQKGYKWTPKHRANFIATMQRLGHFKKKAKAADDDKARRREAARLRMAKTRARRKQEKAQVQT